MLIKQNMNLVEGIILMYKTGDFTDTELLTLVNDIYDWDNSHDGVVKSDSLLRKIYDEKIGESHYPAMSQFADDIVSEAVERFEKLIKTTMRKCAYRFISR